MFTVLLGREKRRSQDNNDGNPHISTQYMKQYFHEVREVTGNAVDCRAENGSCGLALPGRSTARSLPLSAQKMQTAP